MIEQLLLIGSDQPLVLALVFLLLGLTCSHRSTASWHSLPHCPTCGHTLTRSGHISARRFLSQVGRCPNCQNIMLRYPLMALLCGALGAMAAYTGGWLAGTGLLVLWVGVGALLAERRKHQGIGQQAGLSLTEVIVAVALLTTILIPMLDAGAFMRGATAYPRQMEVALATAELEFIGNRVYRTTAAWPGNTKEDPDGEQVGPWYFEWYREPTGFTNPNATAGDLGRLKQYTVTVTCAKTGTAHCPREVPQVRVVGVIVQLN